MKAVILAGGLGKRLEPLTKIIPKPLLPVGEKSVLEITIQKLKEQGIDEIILAVSYKSDLFESYFGDGSKFGVKISYSTEKEKLGTAGPLTLVKDKLIEPFLVMNGDIITSMDFNLLKEEHIKNNADLTLVTKHIQLPLHYGVVEKSEGSAEVISITEKPVIESEVNAGIYFINPKVLNLIPSGKEFDMTELLQLLLNEKKKVFAHNLDGYWLDIGQMKDYEKAQEFAESGLI